MAWLPQTEYEDQQALEEFYVKAYAIKCTRRDEKSLKRRLHLKVDECDNAIDLFDLASTMLTIDEQLITPPHSESLERWAIGGAILWPDQCDAIFEQLSDRSFYSPDLREVFSAMLERREFDDFNETSIGLACRERFKRADLCRFKPIAVIAECIIDVREDFDAAKITEKLRVLQIKRGVNTIAEAVVIQQTGDARAMFKTFAAATRWSTEVLSSWDDNSVIPADPITLAHGG